MVFSVIILSILYKYLEHITTQRRGLNNKKPFHFQIPIYSRKTFAKIISQTLSMNVKWDKGKINLKLFNLYRGKKTRERKEGKKCEIKQENWIIIDGVKVSFPLTSEQRLRWKPRNECKLRWRWGEGKKNSFLIAFLLLEGRKKRKKRKKRWKTIRRKKKKIESEKWSFILNIWRC